MPKLIPLHPTGCSEKIMFLNDHHKLFSKNFEDFGKLIKKKTHIYHESHLLYLKMESIRRQGKGRRVDLGGKICLIPCRASCFVSVDLRETVE